MIFEFKCDSCGTFESVNTKPFHPPPNPSCCSERMRRLYNMQIDTSMCRDHDDIPDGKRVVRGMNDLGKNNALREERRFHNHIQNRRKELKDGNRGSMRHTHSVPADLFHGKIRETGDKNYWSDPRNMRKHKSCKVDG